MRRTQALQAVRTIKFLDISGGCAARRRRSASGKQWSFRCRGADVPVPAPAFCGRERGGVVGPAAWQGVRQAASGGPGGAGGAAQAAAPEATAKIVSFSMWAIAGFGIHLAGGDRGRPVSRAGRRAVLGIYFAAILISEISAPRMTTV